MHWLSFRFRLAVGVWLRLLSVLNTARPTRCAQRTPSFLRPVKPAQQAAVHLFLSVVVVVLLTTIAIINVDNSNDRRLVSNRLFFLGVQTEAVF